MLSFNMVTAVSLLLDSYGIITSDTVILQATAQSLP